MNIRRNPVLIIIKILKCLIYPVTRLRKLYKKHQSRQFNISIILLILAVGIFILFFLLWTRSILDLSQRNNTKTIIITTTKKYDKGSPMRHIPLNQIYKNVEDDNDTFGMMSDRRQGVIWDNIARTLDRQHSVVHTSGAAETASTYTKILYTPVSDRVTSEKLDRLSQYSHKILGDALLEPLTKDRTTSTGPVNSINMLDTPGCKIPIAMIKYRKYLNTNESNMNKCKNSCGQRALFLNRENGNKIRVYVDSHIMKQYLSYGDNYYCCYRSIRSRVTVKNKNIEYSVCTKIKHGNIYQLESDFVNVKCYEYDHENVSYTVYDDLYVFTKNTKINEVQGKLCDMKYNVLVVGMNSMSLPRIVQSMPRTIKFFKENFWLGFRAYHKIGDNTLPNLMALLTGQNISTWNKCREKADKCRDTFVWDMYKKEGYVTAFGEDSTSIRNTFNNKLLTFNKEPTDHYINPVFLTRAIKSKYKSILCSGKISYGQQLLNYALDFVNTYKKHQFFGVFWMDSYSSDINNCPRDSDKMFENFFFKLSYTGSLVNTFVIFLSDQGIRYGSHRMKVESYYDERMPFLFMWIPTYFRGSQLQKLRFLVTNQFRLVTPYDLFKTLVEIKDISAFHNSTSLISNSDFIGQSILYVISEYRTCDDVRIHMKWCSCHNLFPLPIQDNDGIKAVTVVISKINSLVKSTQTEKCHDCLNLHLKENIRIHFYYNKEKASMFYVVAFTVFPGEMSYEATVSRKGDSMNAIGPISLISPYSSNIGRCAIKPRYRIFCVCKKVQNCSLY